MKFNISQKIILSILVIIILSITTILIVVSSIVDKRIRKESKTNGLQIIENINSHIIQTSNRGLDIALSFTDLDIVKQAYRFENDSLGRDFLRKNLSNQFDIIREHSEVGEDLRIHFHKPPAKSFWRIWRAEGNGAGGDDLSSFRNTILKISETHEPVKGIEVGKGGLVIRGIAPIFDNDNYVGSVESFFYFDKIIKDIALKENQNIYFFLPEKKARLAWKLQNNPKIGEYTFVVQAKKESIGVIDEEILTTGLTKKHHTIVENTGLFVFPIYDAENSVIAVACYTHNLDKIKENAYSARNRMLINLILTFIIIFIAIIISTKKFISKPILTINKELIDISEGNLSNSIKFSGKDEFGLLVNQINKTFEKIRNVLIIVKDSNKNMTGASNDLKNTSQDVSQGASEQAASVEEVSASMEEMSANIEQNVENAKITEKEIYFASVSIYEGSKSVKKTAELMENIEEKLGFINDIAKQTNILALNASVEAASAGEYGKGFAVIAREIRQLAEDSRKAAFEIREAISSGVSISEKANMQLTEIVKKMENSSDMIKQIVVSSREQKNGVEQVLSGIEQLNKITQKNAAIAEEMASSSQDLANQTTILTENIIFFKLKIDDKENETIDNIEKLKEPEKFNKEEEQKNNIIPEFDAIPEFDTIDTIDKNTIGKNKSKEGFMFDLGKDTSDDDFEMF